ncbi:MAG: hypothetical protein U0931_02145 [Vulcanimicrobiota bacterium]
MQLSNSRRGSSLVETIIALVLLTGALLLVTALMNRSNRYQQRSESLLDAAALADKVMADVRAWARDGSNYDGSWSAWNGVTKTDPDYPGLEALVDIKPVNQKIFSPNNPSELVFGAAAREMRQGSVTVRIQAGRDVSSPVGRVVIWTIIAPPSPVSTPAKPCKVVVTSPVGGPMAVGETRGFTAQAFDGEGRALPPCCFEWRVISGSGMAHGGSPTRDGRSYSISHTENRDLDPSGSEPASGGVSVEADARIMGKIVTGSLGVTLQPGPPTP